MDPSLSEVIARYLVHAEAVALWCPDALAQRKQRLNEFCSLHGAKPVCELKPFLLTDWIESHSSWRSTATRKAAANQVNAVLNWAVSEGRIPSNPLSHVNYPEADPRPCLPDSTLEEFLLRANPRYARAIRFLRLTGCRLSDLCRMLWSDVDFERGIVTLDRHKSRKRTGKPKVFALVPEAVDLLREVGRESGAVKADAGKTNPVGALPASTSGEATAVPTTSAGAAFVFLNNRGHPWTRRTLGQQLRRMKERYHIEGPATLHGIRHQHATEAIKAGAPLKHVSLQLGHASTAITERYYCHVSDADVGLMRDAASLGQPKK